MHAYRTHTCLELKKEHVGQTVRLSGWVHRKRDHGGLLFIDLRDHFGITQIVFDQKDDCFAAADNARNETVLTITGTVIARSDATINPNMQTGEIEIAAQSCDVQSACGDLPIQVNSDEDSSDELRMRYRYLDLRRARPHANIMLRSKVISFLRDQMRGQGFEEFQTPILTASSPEGARDYLVPSRHHPGKFYALPQAPQMFKQLFMIAGFDKYFQIAPCFRDEDSRADRSPGEFYQLDFEMSFATQDDVFAVLEPVLRNTFEHFRPEANIAEGAFPHIPYKQAMLEYGCDKPDLRIDIKCSDVTEAFKGSGFGIFAGQIDKGACVRAIPAPKAGAQARSFFDKANDWARGEGAAGLGYIVFNEDGTAKGPIASKLDEERLHLIRSTTGAQNGDAVFFLCGAESDILPMVDKSRRYVAEKLDLVEKDAFRFCWVVDFPMFETDQHTGKLDFSHNPFSMPQGGMDALLNQNPLDIKAYQYDIICNGIELSSGAIRNHVPDIMYKAFEIAGYTNADVEAEFGGMLSAFKLGAPPHGGAAPGVDRMVMLLADEPNIREVIPFPMTGKAEDLMLGAPSEVPFERLQELHLRVQMPKKVDVA